MISSVIKYKSYTNDISQVPTQNITSQCYVLRTLELHWKIARQLCAKSFSRSQFFQDLTFKLEFISSVISGNLYKVLYR